ncbi:histone-binding protein N1/N2-like [Macrosteles quadrilineatus]|uniref:histone-binding protein N1/N2-like n=1 Tax=Macrosteles quadrilineatus TaxID=74068 RepID=UPI0023E0C8C2|nr:histone-binding protein N1/N2-like [Macrosteles quadrilineatus]
MPEVNEGVLQSSVEKAEAEGSTEQKKTATNGTSENGVSSTSPEKKSPDKNDPEVLLAQGKRHLFIKDFSTAVSLLGDACAKFAEAHGDLADECAEAYFNYGRALLELAREESNVLGTEPEKDDGEENEEEGEDEGGEEEGEGKSEEGEAEAKNTKETEADDDAKDDDTKNEDKEAVADETIDTTKEVNEVEEGEEEKEEDVDNLQLAWEVFELAKNIYERQKEDAKLAQTYLFLGEVGMESENYVSAVDDMKKCVEIQKQILPPHHRDIAETYFQLGIACSLSNEFDEAIVNFKTSCEILEARIKELEDHGAPEVDTEKDPFYSVEKEVSEIKALLPEIKTKISDMEDFKQETLKRVIEKIREAPQSSDGAGSSSSSSSVPVTNGTVHKPATDISHLVRKKRKPDEETVNEPVVKKSCTEEVKK